MPIFKKPKCSFKYSFRKAMFTKTLLECTLVCLPACLPAEWQFRQTQISELYL